MKKAALAISLLALLTTCELINQDLGGSTGNVRLTVKNCGLFEMCVDVYNDRANYSMDSKLVPPGKTAVWTTSTWFCPGIKTFVKASYSDGRLDSGGFWQTSFNVSDGDDIKLTIPGCPGWYYCKPEFYSITYGNDLFVALARVWDGEKVFWSRDGTADSWNASKYLWYVYPSEIAFVSDRFAVLMGCYVEWTTDLAAWPGEWSDSYVSSGTVSCIEYGKGRFVAADGGSAYWSTDCSPGSWSKSAVGDDQFYNIAFGNDRFVAVGRGSGKAAWSPDGTEGSWTESTAAGLGLYDIAYGNGRFVAVGKDGTAAWSSDGSPGSWTESRACSRTLGAVAFGSGRFVAVGAEGKIAWSPDGSPGSWIESSTGGPDLLDIAYGNGRFVAAGPSGRVMSSPDGSAGSWTDTYLFE